MYTKLVFKSSINLKNKTIYLINLKPEMMKLLLDHYEVYNAH